MPTAPALSSNPPRPAGPRVSRARTAAVAVCLALGAALACTRPPGLQAAGYAPGRIVVRYGTRDTRGRGKRRAQPRRSAAPERDRACCACAAAKTSTARCGRLRRRRGVLWAVPDFRAHTSGTFIPNDPGNGTTPGGWQELQWNFVGPFGIEAPRSLGEPDRRRRGPAAAA